MNADQVAMGLMLIVLGNMIAPFAGTMYGILLSALTVLVFGGAGALVVRRGLLS